MRAPGDGVVAWVGEVPRGRFVSISHPGGIGTDCLGLGQIVVQKGDDVKKGRLIGRLSGDRDDSSPAIHLHFGATLNGAPFDPRLLVGGLDSETFIRLCPVGSKTSESIPIGEAGGAFGFPAYQAVSFRGSTHAPDCYVEGGVESGESFIPRAWNETKRLLQGGINLVLECWNKWIIPGVEKAFDALVSACSWVWNNSWFRAIIAGLAAAIVIIAAIVLAVAASILSVIVGIFAAIAALVVCVGFAIYKTATTPGELGFLSCFLSSLSAGAIAAGVVVSFGTLSGACACGWASLGFKGIAKTALWSGIASSASRAASDWLVTGEVSPMTLAAAFAIGAFTGVVVKSIDLGLFSRGTSNLITRAALDRKSLYRVIQFMNPKSWNLFRSGGLIAKDIGKKLAYIAFSGTFTSLADSLYCLFSGRDPTVSRMLSSFVVGAFFGWLAFRFGGKTLEYLLRKSRVFQSRMGRLASKLISSGITSGSKAGAKHGLNAGLEKVFEEEKLGGKTGEREAEFWKY